MSNTYYHRTACISLIALITLCLCWEILIAPLRPGGSWMALKAIPLLLPLRGIIRKDNYTLQWSSMLIWLYFIEGVVRGASDKLFISSIMAWIETGLSLSYFLGVIFYLAPIKKAAKARIKASQHE